MSQMFSTIFLYSIVFNSALAQFAGPYDLLWTGIGPCKDLGTNEVILDLKLGKQVKKTVHINGNVSFLAPYSWSDKIIVNAKAMKVDKNGRETKPFYAKTMGGACSAFKFFAPEIADRIAAGFGIKSCPLKTGNYTLDSDLPVSIGGIPVFVYGKYSVELVVEDAKTSKRVGCFIVTGEFLPKKTSKRKGK